MQEKATQHRVVRKATLTRRCQQRAGGVRESAGQVPGERVPVWLEDGGSSPPPACSLGTAVTSCTTGSSSSLAILGGAGREVLRLSL